MKKLIWIIGLVLFSGILYATDIDTIQNNESGFSVRTKLNALILWHNDGGGSGTAADSTFLEVFTNKISELTSGYGVTIDGTKIQDYTITPNEGAPGQYITADSDELSFGAGGSEVLDMKAVSVNFMVPLIPDVTDVSDVGSADKFVDEFFGRFLRFKEQTPPDAPPAARGVLYMSNVDQHIYFRSSAGTFDLTTGTGGSFDTTHIYFRIDSLISALNDTVSISEVAYMRNKVFPLINFGGGNATSGSTAAFTTSAYYGSYYNSSEDTLVVTSMISLLGGTTPSVAVQVEWHATHGSSSATQLFSTAPTITSTTTGDEDTSFANIKIPPGMWVWCTTPTVTTAPTYMIVVLSGYRI